MTTLIIGILMFLCETIFSQEKYAVLICGDNPEIDGNFVPDDIPCMVGYCDEFWNDPYMMWEMLIEQGYDNDNIFLLYYGGFDYTASWPYPERYNPRIEHYKIIGEEEHITDFAANEDKVIMLFNGLTTGNSQYGIPQLNENDFLFIWTFGHGKENINSPNELLLKTGSLTEVEFFDLVSPINCYKKVILMQQCNSGNFINYNWGNSTFFLTATSDDMIAASVEKSYYDDIDYPGDPDPGVQYDAYERDEWPFPDGEELWEHNHGEFTFHIMNALRGVTPGKENHYEIVNYNNFMLTEADSDNDYIVSVYEAGGWKIENNVYVYKGWNNRFNSRFFSTSPSYDNPQLYDPGIGATTSLLYPTIMNYTVENSETIRGITGIPIGVHVTSGNILTFTGAKVYLDFEGKLIVDAGATLVIDDNVKIYSKIQQGEIIVNGSLQIGSNVQFLAEDGADIRLVINNASLATSIAGATFERGFIESAQAQLSLTGCSFTGAGGIDFSHGNLILDNCSFDNCCVYASQPAGDNSSVTIQNVCTFTNSQSAVHITAYPVYTIENSTFYNCGKAIALYSLAGSGNTKSIYGNHISCCDNGIVVYNSAAIISMNHVYENVYGILSLNRSQVSLEGNQNAMPPQGTQQIRDNTVREVYATEGSFPYKFTYNAVYDDASGLPLVTYTGEDSPLDVRYNYGAPPSTPRATWNPIQNAICSK